MFELAHKIIGKGEKKVIVLHDLMGCSKTYDSIIDYIDEKQFTYIFVDLRGYGLSKSFEGEYTCYEAATDIQNLISILKLEEVTLLAHSMSSMIAQKLALIEKKVKKLILVSPISPQGVNLPDVAKEKLLNDMQTSLIEETINSASRRYNQKYKDRKIKIAYNSSTLEARLGYMIMYLYTDFFYEAKSLNIPVRIIVGKNDFAIFALKNIKDIFSKIYKDIKIVESQEAGHYPMVETPVYFASKIEEFCKE